LALACERIGGRWKLYSTRAWHRLGHLLSPGHSLGDHGTGAHLKGRYTHRCLMSGGPATIHSLCATCLVPASPWSSACEPLPSRRPCQECREHANCEASHLSVAPRMSAEYCSDPGANPWHDQQRVMESPMSTLDRRTRWSHWLDSRGILFEALAIRACPPLHRCLSSSEPAIGKDGGTVCGLHRTATCSQRSLL
jgi:hypothetical protein